MGHNTENVSEANYLGLISRGVLCSAGKLHADCQKPCTGPERKVTIIEKPAGKK